MAPEPASAGLDPGPDATVHSREHPQVGLRITLLSRPGCHLCDDARAIIAQVAADLGVGWTERDITASREDESLYWDRSR